jgi:hypothetical protein
MDADTRDLLRESVREMFASGDDDIVAGLNDLGWQDVVAEDPDAAVDLLFTEQGAAGKASSALDTVAYVDDDSGNRRQLLHPLGVSAGARRNGSRLDVDAVLMTEPGGAAVVAGDDGLGYVIEGDVLSGAALAVGGFDPGSRLRRVQLSIDVASAVSVEVEWSPVFTAARRALAAELVGNGTAMLRLAAAQVADRHQFGRPIGANQSPRHRLAEAYALLGGAGELVRMAWQSGSAWDARVAKAYAGHAVDTTSRACLQVCGAIGLTTEHLLPGYVQRARILDGLYGGWSSAVSDLGAEILAAGVVPAGDRL